MSCSINIPIGDTEFDIEAEITEVENAKLQEKDQPVPKIQRVPKHLLEHDLELHQYSTAASTTPHDGGALFRQDHYPKHQNKVATKYYTPKMISIGPIHHHLRLGEQLKRLWTVKYVQETNKSTRELYQNIKDDIQNLKKLFAEDVLSDYKDDDRLAWMLFIDGCSVLYFMKHYTAGKEKSLKIKYDQMIYMKRDLIMLENQLPYQVLLLLCPREQQLRYIIQSYLSKSLESAIDYHQQQTPGDHHVINFEEQPTHLLHFLRRNIINHIIGCACERQEEMAKDHDEKLQKLRPTYKSIQDLKASGIGVKKAEKKGDIHYEPGISGNLVIPPFTINDTVAIATLNVMAYEMCPDFENEYEVSSFIEFLDSVVDNAEDVKELRKAGIIVNMLGSDEEVAQLFNSFSSDLVVPQRYETVRREIELQYSHAWRTWIAQLIHTHFTSPWTICAFLAAILALFLSAILTFYAIREGTSSK